jgi:hypothetical protein
MLEREFDETGITAMQPAEQMNGVGKIPPGVTS